MTLEMDVKHLEMSICESMTKVDVMTLMMEHAILFLSNLLMEKTIIQKNGVIYRVMALFRITVKQKVRTNGIVLDPGMQVEVVTQSYSDPVHMNGGQVVADAFMRIYGVDIKKAGALNGIYLDVKRIG